MKPSKRRACAGVPSPTCWRRWNRSPRIRRTWWPTTTRVLKPTAKPMSCRVICLSAPGAATRPFASGFSPGSMATNRKARTRIVQFIKLLEARPELADGLLPVVLSGLQSDGIGGRHAPFAPGQGFEPRVLEKFRRAGSPAVAGRTGFPFVSRHHFPAHRRHQRWFLWHCARRHVDEISHRTRLAGRREISAAR